MSWHPDPMCDQAIIQLLDAFTSWERSTGRGSLFILIPVENDEKVIIADSGSIISRSAILTDEIICERIGQALRVHDDPNTHNF